MGFGSGDGSTLGVHSSQTSCLLRASEYWHDAVMKAHTIAKSSFVFRIRNMWFLALAAGLLNGISVPAATTYSWTNAAAATYNLMAAWTPNGLPGSADTATV